MTPYQSDCLTIVTSHFDQQKVGDTSISPNGMHRLDNCDITTSRFHMNSEVDSPNQTSFTATHLDQTHTMWHAWIERIGIKPNKSVYAANSIPSM